MKVLGEEAIKAIFKGNFFFLSFVILLILTFLLSLFIFFFLSFIRSLVHSLFLLSLFLSSVTSVPFFLLPFSLLLTIYIKVTYVVNSISNSPKIVWPCLKFAHLCSLNSPFINSNFSILSFLEKRTFW